ncbi:MAG TPA: alpha/beta hydrolase [Candidatus Binatia bacterium]|nr:alpha/beta hydrolase [Candidatus Binatia bacterium]
MRTKAMLITLTAMKVLLLALLSMSCPFSSAVAQQEIVTLPTRPGVTQSYFLTSIPQSLQALALLFPGSGGLIQLRAENGKPRFNQGNFLVRSRAEFIKRGVAAAIIDAPSDQQSGWGMSDEFRLGNEHLSDISRIIDDLAKRFLEAPLFLIGTSRGTISAAALSSRLGERTAGAVLTATMFRHTPKKSKEPGEGLSKFDFATVKVPLLLVHHVSDQCASTPYGDAARLSEKFPLISVFGGATPQSGPCEPFSQHGFLGKESETVEQIVNWMLKKPFSQEVK